MHRTQVAALAMLASISASSVGAQPNAITLPSNDAALVQPRNVTVAAVHYRDSDALEVRLTGPYLGPDKDTFAFVPDLDFHDGTIEVDVAGSPLPNAPSGARGFVGVAFRIDATGGSFACEGFYIRPTNGRAEDQVRRNHSTQYFSYPGYDFDRLRREAPGQIRSPTPTSCLAHGPVCVSRSRAQSLGSSLALPHSPCSSCVTSSVALMRMGLSDYGWTTAPTATSATCRSTAR